MLSPFKKIFFWVKCVSLASVVAVLIICVSTLLVEKSLLTPLNSDGSGSLLIKDVSVLSMDSGFTSELYDVVIHEGVIESIFNSGEDTHGPTKYDHVIEGKGRYIIPGLIDLNVKVLSRNGAKRGLSYGVTTARNSLGIQRTSSWVEELENRDWFGTQLVDSSPVFTSLQQQSGVEFNLFVGDRKSAEIEVERLLSTGTRVIQVDEEIRNDILNGIASVGRKKGGLIVGYLSQIDRTSEAVILESLNVVERTTKLHLQTETDDSYIFKRAELSKLLKLNDIIYLPRLSEVNSIPKFRSYTSKIDELTPAGWNHIIRSIYTHIYAHLMERDRLEITKNVFRNYERINNDVTYMHQYGVKIGLASGSLEYINEIGKQTVTEALLLNEAGLPELEVIRAATHYGARALGLESEIGDIKIGYKADLLMFNENPLNDLSVLYRPDYVIKNGVVFNASDLDALRRESSEIGFEIIELALSSLF